ncbi:hypothetical protein F5Y05DRAFT_380653 [Hypoxylon sp. FL0543]|nr:hypothetical protein F5Y05DRAFT_380653 [Hypoxylon sp. FL0543]
MSRHSRLAPWFPGPSRFTDDMDSDQDFEMTSPLSSPADKSYEDSKASQYHPSGVLSKPLTMRITGSQGQPLFPTSILPVRFKASSKMAVAARKDSFSVSEGDDGIQKKRSYKYESMARMIDLHVEELKKRPPLGESNGFTKEHGGAGESQNA